MTNISDAIQKLDEELCKGCTKDDCTNCSNQSEIDRCLGPIQFDESVPDFVDAEVQSLTTQEPTPQMVESSQISLLPAPLPKPGKPKKRKGRPKKEVDTSIPKRGPGAPKGNLNALKHGIYVNGCHVSNTTPFERAELSDLKTLIVFIRNYITKAYENGLTLKNTEEINHTLRDMSLAAIALTRLIHVHNQNSFSGFPSELKANDQKSTQKLINFYNNKIDIYQELTTPPPGLSQIE